MKRQQIRDMIMELLGQVDYDIQKSFDPETAEDPEYAEEHMDRLIDLVEKHLPKKTGKNKS